MLSIAVVFALCGRVYAQENNSKETAYVQESCSQVLIKAQISYYEGRANEVPSIMKACLQDGFTIDEKLQAYRLLTITYLYLNEPVEAENSLLALLKLNPEYKINEAVDPTEFINLFKRFRTLPVYLVGVKAGANLSFVDVMTHFSVDNTLETDFSYQPQLHYQAGASLEIPLNKKISFTPEIFISGKKFLYKSRMFGYEQLFFTERQNLIELPLTMTYTMGEKSFKPFFSAGMGVNFLLRANASVRREDYNVLEDLKREVTGPNITVTSHRRMLNYSAILSTGFKFKHKKNLLILQASYKAGVLNIVKGKQRYSNADLIYSYGYIDNDLRINDLTFSLGYLIPIYQPKILNKAEQ